MVTDQGMDVNSSIVEPDRSQQKSGYLLKYSSTGLHRKRFFELNGEYLTYFKTERKRKLLEAISIPSAACIRLTEYSHGASKPAISVGCCKTILIDMRDRQYELLADTVEDARSWMKELTKIREAELIKSLLERSIRQNWTFTLSGKAVRNRSTESFKRQKEAESSSKSEHHVAVEERRESNLMADARMDEKNGLLVVRTAVCCSCIPKIF
jgi:PH domain